MSGGKLLTIFGSTGNQGGSVIDTVLAHPELKEKYSLRGITRDPSSGKSKALADKGVEMVAANLNDAESLKAALKGSYGVFGVTDFWSIMDKNVEIQQGKNIFEACKAEGVEHYIFSTLPHVEKLTHGVLKRVDHFDGKAEVAEYIEKEKGGLIASYFVPAMFISGTTNIQVRDGKASLSMPFPNENIVWPVLEPRRDSGKYVMGLFEGGKSAHGVFAHGVSTWTTPKKVVGALGTAAGREVSFNPIPADVFEGILAKDQGEQVAAELVETMRLVGEYSYYGKGQEEKQGEHDKWLYKGSKTMSYEEFVKENGPWKFE